MAKRKRRRTLKSRLLRGAALLGVGTAAGGAGYLGSKYGSQSFFKDLAKKASSALSDPFGTGKATEKFLGRRRARSTRKKNLLQSAELAAIRLMKNPAAAARRLFNLRKKAEKRSLWNRIVG